MTREEALAIKELKFNNNGRPVETEQTDATKLIINRIYDDFKKQTCNNCKWYNEPICSASKCEDINELGQYVVRPTFGCNEWEGKVND